MTDDPYKNEIKQEVMQDLQYRAHLNETQRQAEEYYFNAFPQHREAKPLVLEEASAFLRERPEFNTPGQSKEKIDEAVRTLGQRVDERLSRATRREREEPPGERGLRALEPSDADRAEAFKEDEERFRKIREPR